MAKKGTKKEFISDNLAYADDETEMDESKEKSLENEKGGEEDNYSQYGNQSDAPGSLGKRHVADRVGDITEDAGLTSEEKIKKLMQKLNESNDKILRLRAEFENYRNRMHRELSETRTLGKITAIEEMLPVMDHFKMAIDASCNSDNLDTIKEGMKLIQDEFDRCFKSLGVETIPTEGQHFDPKFHEAVSTESSSEIEEGHIIKEWKTGYRIGDRLLRPASVVVSKGPE